MSNPGSLCYTCYRKNDTEGIHELANKSTSQTTSTTSAATQTSAETTPISAHTKTAAATALIPKKRSKNEILSQNYRQ